ncbi:MAG: hypothetical protein U0361_25195 [Nitrospiraceae bacterium]
MTNALNAIDVMFRLNDVRTRFNHVETALAGFFPYPAAHDMVARLLTQAEEFGVAHVEKTLHDHPERFHLSPDEARSALPLIGELHGLTSEIDRLAAEHNRQMAASDPDRAPIYYVQNRPFSIDRDERQMTFVDTGERHPIEPPDDDETAQARRARRRVRQLRRNR